VARKRVSFASVAILAAILSYGAYLGVWVYPFLSPVGCIGGYPSDSPPPSPEAIQTFRSTGGMAFAVAGFAVAALGVLLIRSESRQLGWAHVTLGLILLASAQFRFLGLNPGCDILP